MKIFYSEQHRGHAPPFEVFDGGLRKPYLENADRMDRILAALQQVDWAELCEPGDFGLDPVYAVHDRDYIEGTGCTPAGAETLRRAYEYDKQGRLQKTIDPDGSFTQIVYDALGKQVESYDKLNRKTSYEYDLMGRLIRTSYPDATYEESEYDPEGRQLRRWDRARRLTEYRYDDLGRSPGPPTRTRPSRRTRTMTAAAWSPARMLAARRPSTSTTGAAAPRCGRRSRPPCSRRRSLPTTRTGTRRP